MKKMILYFLLIFCAYSSFGQESHGFFGRKTTLSINAGGSFPMLSWIGDNEFYKRRGNTLKKGLEIFTPQYSVALTHCFSGSFGIGFEYGQEFMGATLTHGESKYLISAENEFGFYEEYDGRLNIEAFQMQSHVFTFKLVFSGSNLLPIGTFNEIGFGYARSSIREEDYLFDFVPYSDGPDKMSTSEEEYKKQNMDLLDYENAKTNTLVISYRGGVKIPLNERIFLNIYSKYRLNLFLPPEMFGALTSSSTSDDFLLETWKIKKRMQFRRLSSVLSGHIGLSIAL